MKVIPPPPVSLPSDSKSRRSYWCSFLPAASFLFLISFAVYAFIAPNYKQKLSRWGIADTFQNFKFSSNCENQCRPPGTEALPQGIVSKTSNFQMRPLWGFPEVNGYDLHDAPTDHSFLAITIVHLSSDNSGFHTGNGSLKYLEYENKDENSSVNLFAIAVGITQRDLVNKMVKKFLSSNFSVMLFHYDGNVDEWREFEWSDRVIHVSAHNQTKWWFAKRFLHPDIVAGYNYIFLWDKDLGVENFNPKKYISIVKSEGLHISQPALDYKSLIHQQITARASKSGVHRRTYKPGLCDGNSTAPPCTGWVEMMAPVFSRAAWRCVWYMIQNDLIHAWGLDYQLGYCSQGDRTKYIGVVDAEYIIHYGHPTLGGMVEDEAPSHSEKTGSGMEASSHSQKTDPRLEVRRQSLIELKIFQNRWKEAIEEDQCWIDPYKKAVQGSS